MRSILPFAINAKYEIHTQCTENNRKMAELYEINQRILLRDRLMKIYVAHIWLDMFAYEFCHSLAILENKSCIVKSKLSKSYIIF